MSPTRQHSGIWIDSGNYRIIYSVDDGFREVLILVIGHRKDVYRD